MKETETRIDNLREIRKIIDSAVSDAAHFPVDRRGLSLSIFTKIEEILLEEEKILEEKYKPKVKKKRKVN
jgi:hypothetical protein